MDPAANSSVVPKDCSAWACWPKGCDRRTRSTKQPGAREQGSSFPCLTTKDKEMVSEMVI